MTDPVARRSIDSAPTDLDPRRPIDPRWLAVGVGVLALVYLSMLNPYWVPSGDGEVYTCIARALARGEGLMFNGSRAKIQPPGWPLMLSVLMRISPQFWFLKLFQIGCMTASMAMAFLIVRRFVSDRASAGIVLLSGTLSVLYPMTFWMHTEAFFCLLGFGSLLIAFRIRDRLARPWEIGLMFVLLAYGSFTRWSGALHVALIIPILFSGMRARDWPWSKAVRSLAANSEMRRLWTRRLAMSCVVFLVAATTFQGTKQYLKSQKGNDAALIGIAPTTQGGPVEGQFGESTTQTAEPTTIPSASGEESEVPDVGDQEGWQRRGAVMEVVHRVLIAGKWFAWLLWQPTRFGQSVNLINIAGTTCGWLAIGLLAIAMVVRTFRHHDYFWIGLAAYTGGLCVIWDNPNARYFVPVAPFIVLGVFLGLRAIRDCAAATTDARWPGRAAGVLGGAFVVATVLSNVPLLAIDVMVFRSRDFYAAYEAGANKQLIEIAAYINGAYREQGLRGPIGLSERYDNMGRSRSSPFGKRALHLLCDQVVYGAPKKNAKRPSDEDTRKWGRKYGLNFYLYPIQWYPWRVWHFRLSPELQAKLDKRKPSTQPIGPSGGWELWARNWSSAGFRQIDLPPVDDAALRAAYPRRVPGL